MDQHPPNHHHVRTRSRPSFSSARTSSTSTTLTSAIALERNNTEAYAGATSETVPSSIVSFHHPHSFQSSHLIGSSPPGIHDIQGVFETRGRRLQETDSLIPGSTNVSSTEHSRSSSRNAPHFRFFTEEQLSNAEGSATVENTEYDIDWDATPEYEQNILQETRFGSRRPSLTSVSPVGSYASIGGRRGRRRASSSIFRPPPEVANQVYPSVEHSSSESARYSIRERIPSDLEDEANEIYDNTSSAHSITLGTNDSLLPDEERSATGNDDMHHTQHKKLPTHAQYLKPSFHEKFYPNNKPHEYFQRFYITEEDLVIGIAGYRTSPVRLVLYNILCVLTIGLFYLLLRWLPYYRVKFYGIKTPLGKAEWVVIENELGEFSIGPVEREWYNRPLDTILPLELPSPDNEIQQLQDLQHTHNVNIPILISFTYRYITFIYSPIEDIFRTNNNWRDQNWVDLKAVYNGLSSAVHEDRMLAFGKNEINLEMKSTLQILFDETLHPFYIFQICSIILWSLDEYYYYAGCIFLISLISIADSLLETKKTSRRLADMSHFDCDVRVFREGFWVQVNSADLVPGDVYEVSDPSLKIFPCDSILLSGDCIVNESVLTGESVPVSKVPGTKETMYQLLDDFQGTQLSNFVSKSFLFNGTKIIRARISNGQTAALAMVVRTGFSTIKGSLIRSMIFPKPIGFRFYEDSFKYIGFMALIAMLGFSISCIQFNRIGLDRNTMILRALDIITIVVPPALPATLTIGTSFALSRLKKRQIYCISPSRVNVSGKLDVICFDKTGTLTEDGLDILGVHVSRPQTTSNFKFGPLAKDVHEIFSKFSLKDCSSPSDYRSRNFLMSLLTCHSLRLVDDELIGDPLDFKMFQFTGWCFEENFAGQKFHSLYEERHEGEIFPENSGIIPAVVYPNKEDPRNNFTDNDPHNFLGIIRTFEFLAELRRMSVIVKPNNEDIYWSFTKGAPEVILEICNKSTIPSDYEEILHHYTHSGYRVIACAGKILPKKTWLHSQKVTREEIESNLEFLGFIIFENKLKSATKPTLKTLQQAAVRTIMCTGDNILTAVAVGRESRLIQNSSIYVSALGYTSDSSEEEILWYNVDDPEDMLDINTLDRFNAEDKDFTLALSGDIFRIIFQNDSTISEEYRNKILLRASIYARMSPDEKHELVDQLQKLDYTVGFCGDGANDCGALKAADVGVSLSEAEASVAAPFTSQVFDISCVLDVIKEGRASLVTSFACFQYMSLYSAIQFITITILYGRGSNLGDFQFLYIDLFLIIPVAIFMSWSKPNEEIVKKRPSANLVSPKILIPLVFNILILFIFQIIPWLLVQKTAWYVKPVVGGDDVVESSDNSVLFFTSNFQYIITAIILSEGPPYREPMSHNIGFIADVLVSLAANLFLMVLNPRSFWGQMFQLSDISTSFKVLILALVMLDYLAQRYLPNLTRTWVKKKRSSKAYKNIIRQQSAMNEA